MVSPASEPRLRTPEQQWVRPAQQQRSQRSSAKILQAAEELFGVDGFEPTSVAQIAKKAGVSVGTVYARFKDKDALLQVLHEHLAEQAVLTADAVIESLRDEPTVLEFAKGMVRFLLEVYSLRPKLIMAIFFRIPTDPVIAARAEGMNRAIAGSLGVYLADHAALNLAAPERAAEFILRFVFGALHQRALYRDVVATPGSDEEITVHLAQAFAGYLSLQETA